MDGDDLDLVRHTLSNAADSTDYLEAPDASHAVAAAEVVAAALGQPTEAAREEEDLAEWITRVRPTVEAELAKLAASALDRVLAPDSELRELWEESDEFADWEAAINDLRTRVRGE